MHPDPHPGTHRRVAAFDFDGTLTVRDSLVPFLVEVAGRRRVGAALAREAGRTAVAGTRVSGSQRRDLAKARVLHEVLAGMPAEDYAAAGRSFAERLPSRFRPDAAGRLAAHAEAGHELVIVSASLGTYLRALAPTLGVRQVIATEMEVVDGVLTGALAGANVRGPEKARRLREWLDGDEVVIWAYGDSNGDRDLLAMADHPTWVSRRRRYLGWKRIPPSRRTEVPFM